MGFQRLKAPFSCSTSASPREVLLSLASIDSLKLNPNKAFQPILHFLGRMSAQPQLDQIIYREIFAEAESLADLRRCFIEGDRASWDDLERSW